MFYKDSPHSRWDDQTKHHHQSERHQRKLSAVESLLHSIGWTSADDSCTDVRIFALGRFPKLVWRADSISIEWCQNFVAKFRMTQNVVEIYKSSEFIFFPHDYDNNGNNSNINDNINDVVVKINNINLSNNVMSTLTSTSTTFHCGSIVCCASPTLRLEPGHRSLDPHTPWRRITRHQGVSNLRIFQRRSPSVSCWPLWVDPGGGLRKKERK